MSLSNHIEEGDDFKLEKYDLLLDNQSAISIFGDSDMIYNIRTAEEPIIVNGIGGGLTVDKIANAGSFGTVYYHPNAMANIISQAAIIDNFGHIVTYERENDSYVVTFSENKKYTFSRKGRLYICNVRYVFIRLINHYYYYRRQLY
jgi:hypothetical protein